MIWWKRRKRQICFEWRLSIPSSTRITRSCRWVLSKRSIMGFFTRQVLLSWKCQNHRGVYAAERFGDYLTVFYSATIDQRVLPKGLIIFPKLGNSKPRPIFPWLKEVNSLCYPLIFPRGEPGYFPKGYPRCDPLPFETRLAQYIEESNRNGGHIEREWDSDNEQPASHHPRRHYPRVTHETCVYIE